MIGYCTNEKCKKALKCARYWENAPICRSCVLFVKFDPDCDLYEPLKQIDSAVIEPKTFITDGEGGCDEITSV